MRQRRAQKAEHPQCCRKKAKVFHPDGDDKEQQHLYLRVQHGKGQQQRKGQAVGAAGHAGEQAGQHSAQHPGQQIDRIAEIAPLPFQRRTDEPGKVDAQHCTEDAAAIGGDEHKGDDAPDLAAQQKISAERQPDADGLVHKQLDGQYKDLPAHQNVGQVRDAETPISAFQPVQPIVHRVPPSIRKCFAAAYCCYCTMIGRGIQHC